MGEGEPGSLAVAENLEGTPGLDAWWLKFYSTKDIT